MKKLDQLALANTLGIIDLILHPAFHIWGWLAPRSYELAMSEFVIGLQLNVKEVFELRFLIFWIIEALAIWTLGFTIATIYNKLSN